MNSPIVLIVPSVNALFAAAWQGAVLAALAALLMRLLPALSAAARSALWTAVFLLTVLLEVLPHALTGIPMQHAGPVWSLASPLWAQAIAALWLGLSLYRALQLATGAWRLRGLARRATPVEALGAEFGSRAALLCVSTEVDRPGVIGFFAPRILLPPGLYHGLTRVELEPILLHETGHLERGDDWTNLLQKLALMVFPLNPALLWLERQLCRERELACDDRVLARTGAPKAYAQALTRLGEHAQRHRALGLVLGAWQRQSELAARVLRILASPVAGTSQRGARFATTAVLATAVAACGLLVRAPQLLSFAPVAALPTLSARAVDQDNTPAAHFVATRAVLRTAPVASPVVFRRVVRRKSRQPKPPLLRTSTGTRNAAAITGGLRTATTAAKTVSAPQMLSADFSPEPSTRQPILVPVVYAVRTPNGWLIFQL